MMSIRKFASTVRGLICWAVAFVAVTTITQPAQAAFHLWNIQEIYTNSSGSLQFIELSDTNGNQNFVGGTQIQASNVGSSVTHTFTLPNVTLGGSTFNHTLLFGTAGIQAAGAPAPDFIIPNNFLFSAGGSLSFFGANSGPYTALPTDGTFSRNWVSGTNSINSPSNYAGATGIIVVPEPATMALLAIGGACALRLRRRTA